MKGKYSGCHMTIYGSKVPGMASIARLGNIADKLTDNAKHKLKIIDWHKKHDENISKTARHFGYTRKTIREWLKAFNDSGPLGLNEKDKTPNNLRYPETDPEIELIIVKTRKKHPAWSKYKIARILKRDYGIVISASTAGRVMKRRGLIDKKKSDKRRKAALRPKLRFPRGLSISRPGDMIQMDTKYIMLIGGRKLFQFTAIDVLTKKRILRVYPSLSSRNGRKFLEICIKEFPFKIRAVQTDNGSEFLKEFDKRCKELSIPHYYTYPRTPKQNTYVERSHGSDKEEFYNQGNVYQDRKIMNQKIKEWQDVWNDIRPHQSLNYMTPNEYLNYLKTNNLPTRNTIILQA